MANLGYRQEQILNLLTNKAGGLHLAAIVRQTGMEPGNAKTTLTTLLDNGYIYRVNDATSKKKPYFLTPKGQVVIGLVTDTQSAQLVNGSETYESKRPRNPAGERSSAPTLVPPPAQGIHPAPPAEGPSRENDPKIIKPFSSLHKGSAKSPPLENQSDAHLMKSSSKRQWPPHRNLWFRLTHHPYYLSSIASLIVGSAITVMIFHWLYTHQLQSTATQTIIGSSNTQYLESQHKYRKVLQQISGNQNEQHYKNED